MEISAWCSKFITKVKKLVSKQKTSVMNHSNHYPRVAIAFLTNNERTLYLEYLPFKNIWCIKYHV